MNSPHFAVHNGGATGGTLKYDDNGLLYDIGTKYADGTQSFDGSAWGSGYYNYSKPLPKGVRKVDVDISIYISCPGNASTRVWVTNSTSRSDVVAEGTRSVDLSAYVNSNEDLYLWISGSSNCAENVGYGAIGTYCRINSISLSY